MSYIPTAATLDKSTFTEGTTPIVPVGGEWNDSSAALTTGQVAGLRITEKRAAHVNLRNETGTEIGTSANPVSSQDVADGAPASAVPAKATQIAGSDGTLLRALATDTAGRQKVLLFDGSGNAITSTANAIDVNIKSGGGAGFSILDEAAWAAATSSMVPAGAAFNDSAAALTTGQQGSLRSTPNRALHSSIRRQDGTELGISANPLFVSDAALEAMIINSRFTSEVGGAQTVFRTAYAFSAVIPFYTSAATLVTAANYFKIYAIYFSFSPAFSATAGGAQTVDFIIEEGTGGTQLIWDFPIFIPSAVPTISVLTPPVVLQTPPGFSYIAKTNGTSIGFGVSPGALTVAANSNALTVSIFYSLSTTKPG